MPTKTFAIRYTPTDSLIPGGGWSGATSEPAQVGSNGDTGYNARCIANFSGLPRRIFSNRIYVSVVAFHRNGIDYVEFSVDGGPWKRVSDPIWSVFTGVSDLASPSSTPAEGGEYVTFLDAEWCDDGKVEVRARIKPKSAGLWRVLQGGDVQGTQDAPDDSLFLVANSGGAYDGTTIWVDPLAGSDSNGGTSQGDAFATVVAALTAADTGDVVYVRATAPNVIGARSVGFNRNIGWITVMPAPGEDPVLVPDPLMDVRVDYLCWEGFNIDPRNGRLQNIAWYRDCTIAEAVPTPYPSSSSVTIGMGAKTFTIATGQTIANGTRFLVWVDDSTYMHGDVTAYNSGTGALTLDVDDTSGTGTYSSWTVQITGDGRQWCAGGDWFTGCTFTNIWRECAMTTPKIARNCVINGSRENGVMDPKVMIDVQIGGLYDVPDGHTDMVQWAGASSNVVCYRVKGTNIGTGVPQYFFADQEMIDVALVSSCGFADGVNELFPSSGCQFGKGDPDRNIQHLVIDACSFGSICIYASDADATSRDVVIRATCAAKFGSDVAGIVTVEGDHAFASSGGFPGTLTQVGSNTSGNDTITGALNSDLTPKVALQNRIARLLAPTDVNGDQRVQQDVGAFKA